MLPPGPRRSVVGQTRAWMREPVAFLDDARARYGDVFTVRIAGEEPWVVVAHPDAVRAVFTGDPAALPAGNEVLLPILGEHSVLLLDGPAHRRERRLLTPPFHGQRVARYTRLIEQITAEDVARWPRGEPFALAPRMRAITLEAIMQAVFGVSGAQHARLRTALADFADFSIHFGRMVVMRALGGRLGPRLAGLRRVAAPVHALLGEEIAARRSGSAEAGDDVLSLLLAARDEHGEPMTDAELRAELLTMLLAGYETTATELSWAFERLVHHPGALARLATGDDDADRTWADAVARETLRLRPVLPVVVRRLATPMHLAGWDLPAGVKVVPAISLVHRSTELYGPDPLAFRPERFLGATPASSEWLPFGGGVRRCLGAAFALAEMDVVLRVVARSVTLRAAGPGEALGRRGISLVPAEGARVFVDA